MIVGFDEYKHMYDFSNVVGVIHVGAHHGQEHGDYSKQFGPWASTHWFEPLPSVYSILESNLAGKFGVKLYNYALGQEESVMSIWEDSENGGQSSSLMKPKECLTEWEHITFTQSVDVQVRTLDSFGISDSNMLVIDAQGYELEVLKGATKTLESMAHVFCEVNSIEMYEGCPTMNDISDFLFQYGFVLRENWWTANNWGDAYWSR